VTDAHLFYDGKQHKNMSWLYIIIVGAIAGWLGGLITQGRGFGVLGNIVVGILGGLIGGWLFRVLRVETTGFYGEILTAFVGALVLIWLSKKLKL
jgi:uncharacterized membrane protein YeaQ/YmgE (transglycosylase-associated protein family)